MRKYVSYLIQNVVWKISNMSLTGEEIYHWQALEIRLKWSKPGEITATRGTL